MTIRKPGETVRLGTALGVTVFLIACGGGGGISPPPPPGDNITVIVTPSSASVPTQSTQQFTANVTGTSNTAVNWSVNGPGSITFSGLYTAPNSIPPNTATVIAASQADPSKSGSASVTITGKGVNSLNPIVAMQNGAGFTLSVNGSGFTAGSRVLFGGVAKPTAFVDSTLLTAQIVSGDISSPGTLLVSVETGGQTAGPLSFFVVPSISPKPVPVSSGGNAKDVNIDVSALSSPSLSFIAAGTCMGPRCSAGSRGAEVKTGQLLTLFLVGNGIVPGTFFIVSGNAGDVSVTQPLAGDFPGTDSSLPAARVRISVSPSAAPGPRNILVTNVGGEIAAFVGGLLITSGP